MEFVNKKLHNNLTRPQGAEYLDIHTHALRVGFPQLKRADRLRHADGRGESDADHCRADGNLTPSHARKAPQRPVMQVDDIRVAGKGYDKIRHRRADIADHDTRDQKRRHIADLSGNQKNEARRD